MASVRSISSRSLFPIQGDFNRLFSSLFDTATPVGSPLMSATRAFVPALDVTECEDAFVVSVDLPGLSEDQVKVEILDGVLSISGERATTGDQTAENYRRIERASGRFSRRLSLPEGVDPAGVRATAKDGVLEVTVPKPEAAKPQQVQIEVKAAA